MKVRLGRIAILGALALRLILAIPQTAHAAGEGEIHNYLISIGGLYESLDYELALNRIQLARQLPRGTEEEVTLSLYEGIILCEMGKEDRGTSTFKSALFLRPDAKLPEQVAPKVEQLFESLREQVKRELAPLLAKSEPQGPPEKTEPLQEPPEPSPAPPATEPTSPREPPPNPTAPEEAPEKDLASTDPTPASEPQEEVSAEREQLQQRRIRIQEGLLRTNPSFSLMALRELDKIGQKIQGARTHASLQQATQALDAWQQRHFPQYAAPPQNTEPSSRTVDAGPSPTEPTHEDLEGANPTRTSQPQVEVSTERERLLKRRLHVQELFLRASPSFRLIPLRELDKIGQQLRAASTHDSLQEAAHALELWQERYVPR